MKHPGVCHLCRQECDNLTYEHIPPRSAYNTERVKEFQAIGVMTREPNPRHTIQQRGSGDFCLCEKCNNITGKWYAGAYTDFVKQIFHNIIRDFIINDTGHLRVHVKNIYPLRIVKQAMVLFCDINNPAWGSEALSQCLLNRDDNTFIPDILNHHLYMSWYAGSMNMFWSERQDIFVDFSWDSKSVLKCEPLLWSYFTRTNEHSRLRGADVSDWFKYSYDDCVDATLQLPVFYDTEYL